MVTKEVVSASELATSDKVCGLSSTFEVTSSGTLYDFRNVA